MANVTDILVKTDAPEALDSALQRLGATLVGAGMPTGFVRVDGAYIVRCWDDPNLVKSLVQGGYGDVVRHLGANTTDIFVKTDDPELLDLVVRQFEAALVRDEAGNCVLVDDLYIVRCWEEADFVRIAISQGYGEVVEDWDGQLTARCAGIGY